FDASSSQDVNIYPNNGFIWLWGDGTHPDITSNPITSHNFASSGIYTVSLIVKDANGCLDTLKKPIKAFSVAASFITNTVMCTNSAVTFTNTSTSDTTISGIGYNWTFGDGSTLTTQQNPTHTYSISSTSITSVTVTLIATDTLGCKDTAKKVITISRPNAIFHPTSSINICAGSGVNFASTNSYPNMTWNYGDGTTLGPTPPTTTTSHSYTSSGSYSVTLTVVDAAGCTDVKSYNQLINVQNIPQVYITSPAFNNPNLCYPYQAHFTDSSVVNIFSSRNWNLHNGTPVNNNLDSVGLLCPLPGTYTVSLTETTTNGCTATLTKTIVVNGPLADFSLSPDTICRDQSITFTIKDTSDVSTWHWDFGDGKDTIAVSPISHTYNFHPPNGTTNVQLIYWSKDSSCAQSTPHQISIRQVIASFSRNHIPELLNDTAHCLGTRDTFINTSTGASIYGWNYGDGSPVNTTTYSPAHTYTTAGTYSVELFIKDNVAGCVDTIVKQMIIYPSFSVTATGDTICEGKTAQLNASTANSYSWTTQSPAPLNSTTIANPTTSPSVTATYSVLASDINGCKDSATAVVFVVQIPDTIEDVHTIVIGQTYTLPGSQTSAGYTYTWNPTDNLSCTSCPTPVFNGTVDAHYVETISDVRGCFAVNSTFDIHVEPLASVDVPTAFTPNGDGTNDIVYVAGWGIKSLQYFKIYNRWGELVFESNDIKVGWDGTYKGTPQNMETYVYQVSVTTFISQDPIVKKGYIKLLR
ncbi:MAG TPA: PKD domain-containing protein, partial [Bacteroidia bacterium]|nr:PKD domain-containing protein [Bacteroidia bacterium]